MNRILAYLAALALALGVSVGAAAPAAAHWSDRGCSVHSVGSYWTEWRYGVPYQVKLTYHWWDWRGDGYHQLRSVNLYTGAVHYDTQRCHIGAVTY